MCVFFFFFFFCPSSYVGRKIWTRLKKLCCSDFTVFVAILVLYCNTKVWLCWYNPTYVLLLIISTCVFLRTYSLWESLGKSDDHMPTLYTTVLSGHSPHKTDEVYWSYTPHTVRTTTILTRRDQLKAPDSNHFWKPNTKGNSHVPWRQTISRVKVTKETGNTFTLTIV